MTENILLAFCGVLLSGLFLLMGAPFIGSFFLLAELIIFIFAYRVKKEPVLNKIVFAFPKIILTLIFLAALGYVLVLYLQSIKCINCMQSIRTSAALLPLPIAETRLQALWYGITHTYPRAAFFFAAMFVLAAGNLIWLGFQRIKRKKGGKKHA